MRFERNEPCPCGSGVKFKRCCGRDRDSRLRLEASIEARAEILVLASLTPVLRPDTPAFDEWALGRASLPPTLDLLAEGVEILGERERRRILDNCTAVCAEAWRSVRDDLGDDDEAEILLLQGAVFAGLVERRPIDAAVLEEIELHAEVCDGPLCALTIAIDPSDVWSVVEAAQIDDAARSRPIDVRRLARQRWTPRHARRLELAVGRLPGRAAGAPPPAREALERALEVLGGSPELTEELGAQLADEAVNMLDALDSAA